MALSPRVTALTVALLFFAAAAFGAKHETWTRVTSPHFVVISNAAEKQARQTAVRFEQIRTVFRQYIPIAHNAPSPVITIFAVKDESSLRELLPEYWVPGHAHPAGIFFSRFNQFYAAFQLDAPGDSPYIAMYHEYYHSLTVPYFPLLPTWLAEGLADFFGSTRIDDKEVRMGQASFDLIEQLKHGSWIPLNVLLNVDHTSPYYNEQNKTSEFYAESWALTHYLVVGDHAAHKQLLSNYLAALTQGASSQEAAEKAFGNLADLQQTLENYVENRRFYELRAPAPDKPADLDLQAHVLSDAEFNTYLGGFEATRGRIQEAKPLLEEAIRSDPNLALARENLGFAYFYAGQPTEALSSISEAIRLDPKNALTRYLRAYLTAMSGGLVRGTQIEDDLRASIAASPDFAPPYGLLAVRLSRNANSLPEALSLAQKGVSLEPGIPSLQFDLAEVLMNMHRYDEARTILVRARKLATISQERERADQILASIQQLQSARGSETAEHGGPSTLRNEPSREVTGVITKLDCKPGIQIEVTASSGIYRLHTPPGGQFKIEMASAPPAGFDPCLSFKGLRVSVRYEPDDASGQSGQIELLEVLSPGEK